MARQPIRAVPPTAEAVARPEGAPLQAGGGDGTWGGMEARVASLESDVGHIKTDLADLRSDFRVLKADVGQLTVDVAVLKVTMATRGFVVAVVVGTGAVLGAITTFAPFIQHLLGVPR